jgi:putative PIN family toxin of toxin-antitoxin system
MTKLRFVIDTNILVSSILISSSKPDYALKKVRNIGNILLSETTFQELEEILYRPKFDRYVSLITRIEFITKLKSESNLIKISEKITICRDPKDDKFLELAVNDQANFIITGDEDLLVLNPFRNIEIITVNEFLNRFVSY